MEQVIFLIILFMSYYYYIYPYFTLYFIEPQELQIIFPAPFEKNNHMSIINKSYRFEQSGKRSSYGSFNFLCPVESINNNNNLTEHCLLRFIFYTCIYIYIYIIMNEYLHITLNIKI